MLLVSIRILFSEKSFLVELLELANCISFHFVDNKVIGVSILVFNFFSDY